MMLAVGNVQEAFHKVEQIVGEQNGYLSGSQIRQEGDRMTATMTLRVPADQATYQATLDRLRGIAERVVDEQAQAQDVTEEYVDLDARLRTLRASEESLLGTARQGDAGGGHPPDPARVDQRSEPDRADPGSEAGAGAARRHGDDQRDDPGGRRVQPAGLEPGRRRSRRRCGRSGRRCAGWPCSRSGCWCSRRSGAGSCCSAGRMIWLFIRLVRRMSRGRGPVRPGTPASPPPAAGDAGRLTLRRA